MTTPPPPTTGNVSAASAAVVIAPGGSYVGLADDVEGNPYACWLCAHGIASYVLYYRCGGMGSVAVTGTGHSDRLE